MASMRFQFRNLLLLCMAVLLLACLVFAILWPQALLPRVEELLRATRNFGATGGLLFTCAQLLIALSGILPASAICMLAGAIYGFGYGVIIAATGTMGGAMLAFYLSRSLFRASIERILNRHARLENLDRLIARDGWKIVCLLRISPLMPFSATGFALGLSSISFGSYIIGTLASVPAMVGYVFIGTIADATFVAWTSGASSFEWELLVVGGLATVGLTLYIGRIALRVGLLPRIGANPSSLKMGWRLGAADRPIKEED